MTIPIIASIAVACGTSPAPPAATATDTPTARSQAPIPTARPTNTPHPPPPTSTHAAAPPTNTPAPPPSPTPEADEGGTMANAQHGRELFNSLGCVACHGPRGEGGVGPTIAQTGLPLARVIRQYRAPYQNMPRFGPNQVSEADVADIYAFLHTLPTPETRVPSVLANVTPEAGVGTVRGTIRYSDTGEPAADEQIYILPAAQKPDGSLTFNYLPHLPAGTTDTRGQFEIADVEAQLYAVFYSRHEEPVRDADGNIVLVNVLPGEAAEIEGVIPPP